MGLSGAASAQDQFPFDSELILDVAPMRGSKRIPNMDVDAKGGIAMEMWCNRVEGQFVVAADTVTVLTGQATQRQCPPERAAGRRAIAGGARPGDELAPPRRHARIDRRPRPLKFKVPTN